MKFEGLKSFNTANILLKSGDAASGGAWSYANELLLCITLVSVCEGFALSTELPQGLIQKIMCCFGEKLAVETRAATGTDASGSRAGQLRIIFRYHCTNVSS